MPGVVTCLILATTIFWLPLNWCSVEGPAEALSKSLAVQQSKLGEAQQTQSELGELQQKQKTLAQQKMDAEDIVARQPKMDAEDIVARQAKMDAEDKVARQAILNNVHKLTNALLIGDADSAAAESLVIKGMRCITLGTYFPIGSLIQLAAHAANIRIVSRLLEDGVCKADDMVIDA